MTNFDNKKTLRELMRELLLTGDYFVKREIQKQETSYWGDEAIVNDPDGNVRNLLSKDEIDKRVQNYEYIIKFVRDLSPESVLDLGCGLGDMLLNLDGVKFRTGVDSDVKLAQKRSNKISWIESDVEFFENVSNYEVIICHHVIEHLNDPINFVKRIYLAMKKNSVLIVGTPDFDCGAARLFDKNFRMLDDPTHQSLFSLDSLTRLLRDTGFILIDSDYPFFETNYFNQENLMKLFNKDDYSPAFYGNWFTLFAKKK